jgi:hypothetical protein
MRESRCSKADIRARDTLKQRAVARMLRGQTGKARDRSSPQIVVTIEVNGCRLVSARPRRLAITVVRYEVHDVRERSYRCIQAVDPHARQPAAVQPGVLRVDRRLVVARAAADWHQSHAAIHGENVARTVGDHVVG